MKVYIKELGESFSKRTVSRWIKKDVTLIPVDSLADIGWEIPVIISRSDLSLEKSDVQNMIIYEDIFEKILDAVKNEIGNNFDYYFLKAALEEGKKPEIDTVITGSSYGLFGIEHSLLDRQVNLALASQDLFYSMKGFYEICHSNRNIRNLILCCSYYYFFSDLSKVQNKEEILRVSKVYDPIFHSRHNCILLPPAENGLPDSDIFDISQIVQVCTSSIYKNNYFNAQRQRHLFACRLWESKSKKWGEIEERERQKVSVIRADLHNKSKERKSTYMENKALLKELIKFCEEREITVVVVVPPAYKAYRDHLYGGYKDIFYGVLNQAEGTIHLLDLFDSAYFQAEDFNDMDHLGDTGAEKLTGMILNFLNDLNGNGNI